MGQEVAADIVAHHPLLHSSQSEVKQVDQSSGKCGTRSAQKWEQAAAWNFLKEVTDEKNVLWRQASDRNTERQDFLLRQLNPEYDIPTDTERTAETCQELTKELEDIKAKMKTNRQNIFDILSKVHEPTAVACKWGPIVHKLLKAYDQEPERERSFSHPENE